MKATSKELIKNKIPKVKGIIKKNYNLSKLTWFKVGGNAELYFAPRDKEDLINFLKNLDKKIPIQILGAGSNTLIRDGGISGVTLKLTKSFCEIIYLRNQKFIAGAGLSCIKLARTLANKNLKGLEFFSGIPGTVGGAIKMNAGAYGSQTSDYLEKITTVDRNGKIKEYSKNEIKMTYRNSGIKKNDTIIQGIFKCERGDAHTIKEKIKKLNELRKTTQPISLKTSGSTFKNPLKLKAWKLIKDSGCSNLRIGDAKVSSLHCNFIENKGLANAQDIEELGKTIISKVKKNFGIKLTWEIKIIGSKKKYRRLFNG